MTPIPDDYIDVAERLKQFYEKYPDGRVTRRGEPKVMELGNKTFVVYTAEAYRTPDDPKPCVGTAWEPFPGPTPFTRDSELMNAETSAWGRAIVAAGIPSKKIASANEVANREGGSRQTRTTTGTDKPTDKQLKYLKTLITQNSPGEQVLRVMLDGVDAGDIQIEEGWLSKLNKQQVSDLIETFKTGALPTGQTDVPADVPWSDQFEPAQDAA